MKRASINSSKISLVVLPVAGLGTRFLPITKLIPKEMLPINGKPILQILLEEAVTAGIKEAILVINKNKEKIIKNYLKSLNSLLSKIKIAYVFQNRQLGDGHAILQAEKLIKGRPFAVLFGDDIVISKSITTSKHQYNGLKELIAAFNKTKSSVIALEKIPISKTQSYGVIRPTQQSKFKKNSSKNLFEVADLIEKPHPNDAPSNLGIIGKYVVTPEILHAIKTGQKSRDGELRLIDGFKTLIKKQKIFGLLLKGKRYDTGTPEGYKKAVLELK